MSYNPFQPVNIGLRVSVPPSTRLPINNVLFITDRIDVVMPGTIALYFTAQNVQSDFGLNSNEAQIANMYFGQGNLPTGYLIFASTDDADYISSVTLDSPGSNMSGIPDYTLIGNGEGAILQPNGLVSFGTPSAFGSGYLVGDTFGAIGGMYLDPATFEVTNLQLVSSLINMRGTGYEIGDTIITTGGTSSIAAQVEVLSLSSVGIENVNLITNGSFSGTTPTISFSGPGSGAAANLTCQAFSNSTVVTPGSGYGPGDLLEVIGGTSSIAARYTVLTLKVVGSAGFTPGTGYAADDTIQMAGGAFTTTAVITVNTVDGGGAVLTYTITTPGNYTGVPSNLTQGSTDGSGTGFVLTGALFGVLTVNSVVAGNYTVLPTGDISYTNLSSGGTGYTSTMLWQALAVIVTAPGSGYTSASTVSFVGGTGLNPTGGIILSSTGSVGTYNVINPGNFTVGDVALTQDSTSGTGTGFSLSSCVYGVLSIVLVSGGSNYTSSIANPALTKNFTGSGTGLTVNLEYILSNIAVIDEGNGYDSNSYIQFSGVTGTLPTATLVLGDGYATGFLANVINESYQLAQSQSIGGFSWVGFCDSAVSPFYSNISDAIAELNAIEVVCNNLTADMVIFIQTDDEATLSSAPSNYLQAVKAAQYNSYMTVIISGIPNFSTDVSNANKRLDALTFALQSSIQLATYQQYLKQTFMLRQISLTSMSTVRVGATDNYGITYSQTYLISLVAGNVGTPGQLNMYTQNGNDIAFLSGYLANSTQNLLVNIQTIKIFIRQYLTQQLALLFSPKSGTPVVTYDNEGLDLVSGQINTLLIQVSQSGMIQSGFQITNPVLNPNMPSPKIMGPFQLQMTTSDFVFGLTLDGVITTT